MAERYWEHLRPRRHHYVDGTTGQVLGDLYERLTDGTFVAHVSAPNSINIGEYVTLDSAQAAVAARVTLEEQRAAALAVAAKAATAQADGENA